jgi:glycosyltransferase involved in cell wall biosynthesis
MPDAPVSRDADDTETLSVVVPVYNERDTWRDLLARVEAVALSDMGMEIILVDDGSTDGTREQLREFSRQCAPHTPPGTGVRISYQVIFHERNQGKGAALRTGFAAARGDFVIVQDADLEYDPNDYPGVLEPLRSGGACVVYGSRFRRRGTRKGYLKNYLANAFLTWLSNRFTGHGLTDMETCYKAFRRETIRRIRIEQNRFGFEPEVTAKIAKLCVAIHEVPIHYDPRSHSEGKKINWRDGVKAIWCIVKYGLRSPRRVRAEG